MNLWVPIVTGSVLNNFMEGVLTLEISPEITAQLAKEVYTVQNNFELKTFLLKPIFSNSQPHKQSFQATVGGRIINTRDSFCVAARGGAGYEKDLFFLYFGEL